ncbi:PAS domain S-box protein [Elstera litoralis]|uniref:PAS domain S-box protein n=1 Tax=Elstera litoralis TaxID=552518 RepID=UPI000B104C3B|nr:PAS domain S-box protein [Elstera litoralis]
MPLDPPGQGITLLVALYRAGPWEAQAGILAAISVLALVAGASLLTARRQVRRRVKAEQALRTEYAFRQAMEDSLTVGMRARDLSGRVTYVNSAFCQMVGFEAETLIGQDPPMPYWVPEDYERTQAVHDAVLAGTPYPSGFELRFQRRTGERFDALIYEAPLIDADGKHTGWMGSFVDITARKRAEESQRQQQEMLQQNARLITMGEMASTLAHELNQPLSAITSYATGSLNRLQASGGDAELERALTKLTVQARRAGTIIRRIHDFVRKREPQLTACALPEIAQDALGFLAAEARKLGVAIHADLPDDLPLVRADRILIEQVILNLARNALEAMAAVPRGQRSLWLSAEALEDRVEVRVRDSGPGVAAAQQETLFSAFFTTKPDGMGMGLNICRSLIEFHQGRLWYEPAPDRGGLFIFTLPRAPTETPDREKAA